MQPVSSHRGPPPSALAAATRLLSETELPTLFTLGAIDKTHAKHYYVTVQYDGARPSQCRRAHQTSSAFVQALPALLGQKRQKQFRIFPPSSAPTAWQQSPPPHSHKIRGANPTIWPTPVFNTNRFTRRASDQLMKLGAKFERNRTIRFGLFDFAQILHRV